MVKYIKPDHIIKGHIPRKLKKKYIKEFSREWYYDLVRSDMYNNGIFKAFFPEIWEREMLRRYTQQRSKKIKKLCLE